MVDLCVSRTVQQLPDSSAIILFIEMKHLSGRQEPNKMIETINLESYSISFNSILSFLSHLFPCPENELVGELLVVDRLLQLLIKSVQYVLISCRCW